MTIASIESLEEFLKPRLRLFLSVDVVGSTAFKQNGQRVVPVPGRGDSHWFYPIATFYREIERLLLDKWKLHDVKSVSDGTCPIGDPPTLWKGAGDELIYVKQLSDHRQVYSALVVWIEAINEHRVSLRAKWPALDLKCSAWVAGFPLTNSEVILKSETPGEQTYHVDDPQYRNYSLLDQFYRDEAARPLMVKDFIGPSIDTGFRISSLATPRKLVISVETALLFSSVGAIGPKKRLPMYFDGRIALKGVLGGAPYPIFWIDMLADSELLKAEDRLRGPQQMTDAKSDDVSAFCEAFILDNAGQIVRPYIYGDPHLIFGKPPEEHINSLEQHSKSWKERKSAREIEQQALKGETPAGREPRNSSQIDIDSFLVFLAERKKPEKKVSSKSKKATQKKLQVRKPKKR